jgi:hypothetical protein
MPLPGGLVEHGERRRDYRFRPLSGALELALAEAGDAAPSMPHAVTQALALALDGLAGAPATPERVAALCVADRQYLMRELDAHLGSGPGWQQGACAGCGARFDFPLDPAALPVQEAGPGFPEAQVELGGQAWRFRLPTGADQERLAARSDLPEAEAMAWLMRRLACAPLPADADDAGAMQAVESALEEVSPAIVLRVQAQCPDCGQASEVELDPYRALERPADDLLLEVHRIAWHYHWPEDQILALPQARRRRYLQLIDRARGMAG